MDKFFTPEHDIPVLPSARLDQMTEAALAYRQQAPVNQNRPFAGWFGWRTAFSGLACVMLVVGLLALQEPAPIQSTDMAMSGDEAYADITEIAILNTLDGY